MQKGRFAMEKIIVLCTVNDLAVAKNLSKTLLEKKLIACANIVPQLVSIYEWKGEIVSDSEYLMIFKTKSLLFEELKTEIKSLHPYEVPEIISLKIDNGSKDYFDWIDTVVKS